MENKVVCTEGLSVFSFKDQAKIVNDNLQERITLKLESSLRVGGIDMWVIICQEDNLDPVYKTMIPLDSWCPILHMLIIYDRGEGYSLEKIHISLTDSKDLYNKPWKGREEQEQWDLLKNIIEDRDPKKIGINVSSTIWAAGGLTFNLHQKLKSILSEKYLFRLVSAEKTVIDYLGKLTENEIKIFEKVCQLGKNLIKKCYSSDVIKPGITTVEDIQWAYWQLVTDRGLEVSFKPYFNHIRAPKNRAYDGIDCKIRPGDLIHCDTGINYLRMNSDHQQWVYILEEGEQNAPRGLIDLLKEANRLQDIFMNSFEVGLTGNELHEKIINKAKEESIPNPKIYSHSLGYFLHQPGPLIGLPWNQVHCGERGEVKIENNQAFTCELSVKGQVAEWGNEFLELKLEEDIIFCNNKCRYLAPRQKEFNLV